METEGPRVRVDGVRDLEELVEVRGVESERVGAGGQVCARGGGVGREGGEGDMVDQCSPVSLVGSGRVARCERVDEGGILSSTFSHDRSCHLTRFRSLCVSYEDRFARRRNPSGTHRKLFHAVSSVEMWRFQSILHCWRKASDQHRTASPVGAKAFRAKRGFGFDPATTPASSMKQTRSAI